MDMKSCLPENFVTCLCFHRKTRELAVEMKDKAIEAQVGHLFYLFLISFEAKTRINFVDL